MDTHHASRPEHCPTSGRRGIRPGAAALLAATTLALWVDPASAATPGPATGRHPAHVEASIDHTSAEYGSPLVIAGAVDDPENPGTQPPNGEVELIARDRSGRHVRTIAVHHRLHAGDHGGFTFDVSADRSNYYIVKYLGNSRLAPADSAPLYFAVQSLVTARSDRTQVHRGEAISIAADILPAVPGEGAWVVQLPPNENLANASPRLRIHSPGGNRTVGQASPIVV